MPASHLVRRRRDHTVPWALTILLAATLALGACTEPERRAAPLARTPFDPPAVYDTLWAQVEACSGRTGDPARVRWFLADSFPGRPRRLAQWEPGHMIILRTDVDVALPIVAHEILHDLLEGDRAHEDPSWLACALPVAGANADG